MNKKQNSNGAVLVALAVILIGLFLLCAQQRNTVDQGSDLTADDAQFKQELLEMLDMADEQKKEKNDNPAVVLDESQTDSSDDVLSMLMPDSSTTPVSEKEVAVSNTLPDTLFGNTEEAQPVEHNVEQPAIQRSANEVDRDMFLQVKSDVDRLEKLYDQRSGAADSLRHIIENRSGRIKDLESRFTSLKSAEGTVKHTTKRGYASQDPAFLAAYEDARGKFERYDYQNAIAAFQALLKQNPNNQMADNCQYWIGECYYGLKQYQTAIIEFQKVFAYVQNDKYDDAQLMIAQSYIKTGQDDRARAEFQNFLNNYSESEYLMIAKRKFENI
jgi:TolA-binding protein